jgi:hypothetical protein
MTTPGLDQYGNSLVSVVALVVIVSGIFGGVRDEVKTRMERRANALRKSRIR